MKRMPKAGKVQERSEFNYRHSSAGWIPRP